MDYFLFNGGNYKYDTDDGRRRVPLNTTELHSIYFDGEVPGDTDNSIGTSLDLQDYVDVARKLKKDDCVYALICPDAAIYRGVWAMAERSLAGLEVSIELVNGNEIYEAICADAEGATIDPVGPAMSYDFANGVGQSIEDAKSLARMREPEDCDAWKKYRNIDALKVLMFDKPLAATLGQALYLRMKIIAVPEADKLPSESCKSCGMDVWPSIQMGAIVDQLCVHKNVVSLPCDCYVDTSACNIGDDCASCK